MEQVATRLLARDQVESLLENVSPFVPAITPFPPGPAALHLYQSEPIMCPCVFEDQH
jgi:hypothetical protein